MKYYCGDCGYDSEDETICPNCDIEMELENGGEEE